MAHWSHSINVAQDYFSDATTPWTKTEARYPDGPHWVVLRRSASGRRAEKADSHGTQPSGPLETRLAMISTRR